MPTDGDGAGAPYAGGAQEGGQIQRHGGEMPGRLIMDEQSSRAGSQDLKKHRSYAQEGGAVQRTPSAGNVAQSQPNGPVGHGPNGALPALPNGVAHQDGANGRSQNTDSADPPPLDQSWREDVGNKKLGVMLDRLAQQCFTDMNRTVDAMNAQPPSQNTHRASGGASSPGEDTDETSLAKKRLLLDFAHEQRDRFTRALIISDWSTTAGDLEGVIDLNLQLQKTEFAHNEATRRVGQMKLDMQQAKMPNPNLEGALEYLGTGKSQGMPDLGYLPPTKLTAQQLLRTLKEMNVQLSERLILHEELPYHMREYSVANGRATFTVPGEFEVDLAVADYDPTSSWFFIDIRMLFQPAAGKVEPGLHSHFEQRVNQAIANKGLKGCYDVLHDFVLTYKINTLYDQAKDLLRGKWHGRLNVQRIRRTLTVEYWHGKVGKKSWLEFGIVSGKSNGVSAERQTPAIAVRWFRQGIEIENSGLDFDWHVLDLERMLKQVIAKHASSTLGHIRDGLRSIAAGTTGFTTKVGASEVEPNDCYLALKLRSLPTPTRVWFEPVSGDYMVRPASAATMYTQSLLNEESKVEVPKALVSMLCDLSMEVVGDCSATLEWRRVRQMTKQDDIKTFFGQRFWQHRVYVPSKQWGDEWAIATTAGPGGLEWWIVRLQRAAEGSGWIITAAEGLRLTERSDQVVSRDLLLRVERMAVAEVSFMALAQQLKDHKIPHYIERQRALTASDDSKRKANGTALYLGFKRLMNPKDSPKQRLWAQELVRVTHHGAENRSHDPLNINTLRVRHDIRLTLHAGFLKALQQHSLRSRDTDIIMNETGGLALRLRTPFGAPFVDQLRKRLSSIARLDRYLTILKKFGLRCEEASLSRLAFIYSSNPDLSAHLTFTNDGNLPVRLRLEPADSNPHHRMRTMFEQGLNKDDQEVFGCLVHTLLSTLPFLRTFESLEARHTSKQALTLHVRSASWYSLKYTAPLPPVTFTVRIRTIQEGNKQSLRWHIEQERTKANAESLPEGLVTVLRELWKSNTEDCEGMGSGLVARGRGVCAALERIDETVRRFESLSLSQAEPPQQQQQNQQKTQKQQQPALKQEREVIALD